MAGISEVILTFGGLLIQEYTVYIAYQVYGLFAAIASLVLPVASQVYWVIAIYTSTGVFWSLLAIACAVYLAVIFIHMIVISVAAAASD